MDKTFVVVLTGLLNSVVLPILMAISGIIVKLVSTSIQWKYVGMTLLIIGGVKFGFCITVDWLTRKWGIDLNLKVGDGSSFESSVHEDKEE